MNTSYGFWTYFVLIVSVLSILGCLWILIAAGKTKVNACDDNTTGHVWDEDLRELNNPLPRWWMWMFVSTIVFAFAYLIAYPGFVEIPGVLGWTPQQQLVESRSTIKTEQSKIYASFEGLTTEQLAQKIADDESTAKIANSLFQNICAQCHGADAGGARSFPNLRDNDWLWGGTPDDIRYTITNGRHGIMPPQVEAIGEENVRNVANYVLSLSGSAHDAAAAALGKEGYNNVCIACHGANGEGNTLLGAPRLNDQIWLHGSGEKFIISMIQNGKENVMPAKGGRSDLTDEQINLLTAYVWGLSNIKQN